MFSHFLEKAKRLKQAGFSKSRVMILNKIRRKLNMLPVVPPTVYVEITNECNLNCVMCDRKSLSRQKLRMEMKMFERVIDNASDIGVPVVKLNRFGEPLMQPHLIEMINYAKKRGIPRLFFSTNATMLDSEMSRKIIASGIDTVTFSVDGGTSQTFEKIRRGAKYDEVLKNIETFVKLRDEMGRKKPRMVLNTILMKDTRDEMALVFKKWAPIVDKINVIPVGRYGNVEDRSWIDRGSLEREKKVCNHPFDRLLVFWDGTVTVCCADINGELSVGNVVDDGIDTLWKNETIQNIRRSLIAKNYESIPLCASCDHTNLPLSTLMKRARKAAYQHYYQ